MSQDWNEEVELNQRLEMEALSDPMTRSSSMASLHEASIRSVPPSAETTPSTKKKRYVTNALKNCELVSSLIILVIVILGREAEGRVNRGKAELFCSVCFSCTFPVFYLLFNEHTTKLTQVFFIAVTLVYLFLSLGGLISVNSYRC